MVLSEHKKKANMFKTKRLIEKGVPAASTRCSDHLSRQFLITASTFPYVRKIPQPNIFTFYRHASPLTNTLTHIDKHIHTHAHRDMYKKREYVRLRNFWSCMDM